MQDEMAEFWVSGIQNSWGGSADGVYKLYSKYIWRE